MGETILLVEDEAILAMAEALVLEKEGYSVITARNGREAVEKAHSKAGSLDLILMDINLGPGLDGTEAAQEILKDQDIPILFLSSHTEKEVVEKTEKITSYGYVVKHSGNTVLNASIKMAFKLFQANKYIQEKNEEIEQVNKKLAAINEELIGSKKELERSEAKYRLLADNTSDTIWLMDMDLNTVYISPSVEKNWGFTLKELNKIPLESLVTGDSLNRAMALLSEALSPENLDSRNPRTHYPIEMELYRKDGSKFWSDIAFSLIFDEKGKPVNILGAGRDISERKLAEEALRKSERRVNRKLKAILSPDEALEALDLSDIIDSKEIQKLMDELYQVTHMGIGIIDMKGNVLVGTGWQDICTMFHRKHPETLKRCVESDIELSSQVPPGTFKQYKCKNNLWDIATPIMLGNRHVGNIFLGQFFFDDEKVDYDFFRNQAALYGFDEGDYIEALEKVPRW
ncbi:MAG: PocR ligand-binding domain-containing protein, partial [Spirochaetales bacterium]|nr:PocR ligand-binding domain-containing protein [Spirochaetales bacterium]